MSELSRDDVVSIIGAISDAAIAEIIATGISRDQLVAAKSRVIEDRRNPESDNSIAPGPIAQTVDILERLGKGGIFGESGSTMV